MKIDIETGVVDFGNGLVVDPRESLEEFDKKVPRELITDIGKTTKKSTFYDFDDMYVSGLCININMSIKFDANEKLYSIKFYKTLPKEMDRDTYFDSRTHKKRSEEHDAILERVLKIPHPYKFPWGTVSSTFESRTPSSDIEIRYRKETEYERKMSLADQEDKKFTEELSQFVTALEQYKQHYPELSDLQGQQSKEAEYERLVKWQKDLNEQKEAKKRRDQELMEMFKDLEAQRLKEEEKTE